MSRLLPLLLTAVFVVSLPLVSPSSSSGDVNPPDLSVDALYVEDGRVHARIFNYGGNMTKSVWVNLSAWGEPVDGYTIDLLGGGEGVNITFHRYTPSWRNFSLQLKVSVSPHPGENRTENNVLERTIYQPLPDLVPLSLYVPPGEDRLHFAVKNAGRGRAMSVEAYLLVGDSQEGYCYIPTLNVSEVYRGAFSFSPSSLNESTNLTLVLDPMQYVTELDEDNNEYRIRWHLKDRLKIVGIPEVVEKGEGWVVISIGTSLPTRVSLLYSQEGFLFGRVSVVHNNTMAHQHTLNVSGLKPATTYRGAIRASAADGSFVESKPFYFTTLPPQDDTPPEGNLTHSNTSGLINISTTFWDPRSGMEYVDLFVNGEHIGRYVGGEGESSLRAYAGDLHVTARGVNRGGLRREMSILIRGEEKSYPRITLFSPEEGATYSWNVPIAIHYEDDLGVEQINFYVDGALIDSVVPEHTYRRSNAHTTWDSRNSPNGQHTISIEVRSLSGNVSTEEVTIYTDNVGVPRDPELLITRESVVRVGDRYRVTLRIRNVGEGRATMIRVHDRMRGFIPMVAEGAEPDGVDRRSGGLYCLWPNEWVVQLSAPPLDPGEECTVEYEAVPFLTWACMHHYLMGFWSIGEPKMGHTSMYTTWATYRDENYRREFTDRFYLLTHGINLEDSVTQYMENRRYMTVTAPGRLSWNYGTEGAVAVIQEMAKLAELRDGAVVLLEENRASPLTPQNAWVQIVNLATFLAPEFFSGGYLFIVGNPDIVPTWEIVNPPLNVSYSDHPYGDLNLDNVPDVVVGRVPLDTPREIIRYLQVAEADAAGRLRTRVRESAMVVIGSGDGVGAFMSAGKRAFDLLKRSFDHVDIRNMTDYYVVKEMTTISGSDIIAAVGKTSSLDLRMEVFFYNPGTGEVTALDLSTGRSRTWDAEDHAGKMLVGDIYRTYSGDEFLFPFWGVDTVTITYTEWKKSSFYRLHLPHTFGTPLILDDVDFDSEEEILTYYEESGGILTYNSEGIRESLIPCTVESGSDVLILTADSDSDPDVLILNYTDDKIVLNLSSGGNVVKEFPLEGEEGFVKAGRNSFYLYSPVKKMLYKVSAVEEDDEVRLKFEGVTRIEGFSGKIYLLLGDFLKDDEYLLALYSPSTGRLLLLNLNSRRAREEMNSDLPNLIKGRNFIFYRDHGNVDSWGGFLTSDDSFTLTDSTMRVPVVLSLACLTGNLGYGSLAKTFLKRGAGVFIGATEVSYRDKNNQAIKIVEHYSRGDPIGRAFLKWERELAGDGYHLSRWDLYWIREYNLYGDPAFGTVQLTPLTFAQLIMNTRGELSVELPELMVEQVGGEVVVSLPGGGHTPTPIPLPYISFEYDIGRETTVLEVSALPGEWEEVQVNLTPEPSYLRQVDGDGGFNATDVVPEEGFTYSVVDNPWGNRTLRLTIYPFRYAYPGLGYFRRVWRFEVRTEKCTVHIVGIEGPQSLKSGEAANYSLILTSTLEERVNLTVYLQRGDDILPIKALSAPVWGRTVVPLMVQPPEVGAYRLVVDVEKVGRAALEIYVGEIPVVNIRVEGEIKGNTTEYRVTLEAGGGVSGRLVVTLLNSTYGLVASHGENVTLTGSTPKTISGDLPGSGKVLSARFYPKGGLPSFAFYNLSTFEVERINFKVAVDGVNVTEEGVVVKGRVLVNGEGAEGVPVRVSLPGANATVQTVTSAGGIFIASFPLPPPGEYTVNVTASTGDGRVYADEGFLVKEKEAEEKEGEERGFSTLWIVLIIIVIGGATAYIYFRRGEEIEE